MGFKKGELVKLSDFGKLISGDRLSGYGIIISEPYDLLTPLGSETTTYYEAYDLLVGDEVMKGVPTQFIYRMTQNEESNKRMEEVVKRNETD